MLHLSYLFFHDSATPRRRDSCFSPFESVKLKPSTIRFTQHSIASQFKKPQAGGRSAGTLKQTVEGIADGRSKKSRHLLIRVVQEDRGRFSLDNRRLACFRLLEFAGRLAVDGVRVHLYDRREILPDSLVQIHLHSHFSTENDGKSVCVRGGAGTVGETRDETRGEVSGWVDRLKRDRKGENSDAKNRVNFGGTPAGTRFDDEDAMTPAVVYDYTPGNGMGVAMSPGVAYEEDMLMAGTPEPLVGDSVDAASLDGRVVWVGRVLLCFGASRFMCSSSSSCCCVFCGKPSFRAK